MNVSRPRLRTLAVTTALVAGFMATTAIGGQTATASPPAAAAAAPEAAGSATGFLFYVIPDPQPTCALPLGLNASDDPAIDRQACAFTEFTVEGTTGDIEGDLYGEGETTPFTTIAGVQDTTDDAVYQIALEPDETWPSGRIRLVVRDDTGQIGEFSFLHNALQATVTSTPPSTAPGEAFDIDGTISVHSARSTFSGVGAPPAEGVPASFTVDVVTPDGDVLHTADVTAANDGTFTVPVPGTATNGVSAGPEDNYKTTLGIRVVDATYTDEDSVPVPSGEWSAQTAGSGSHDVVSPATNLLLRNSFVSSVGWVKPGAEYPSTVTVSNPTEGPLTPSIALSAPTGTGFISATGPGTHPVAASGFTWEPGPIAAGESATLILESQAKSTSELDTVVWRDLSSTAVMTVPSKANQSAVSHGPKVIPPNNTYETARYGDRPFPVVPVAYTNRDYQAGHSGSSLESVINDPDFDGSTYNLYQEMSLGQLFPNGTVPSDGVATADFPAGDEFDFTPRAIPGDTCTGGFTFADTPLPEEGTPLYPERIVDGVYQLPGNTEFYGADSGGTAIAGPGQIDQGCGSPGKLVRDAAIIADPEIDYSDYDTDKDGVVDFFMAVFAGCGGNGASQLSTLGCPYSVEPYDNVWPHSSSLEFYYSDPDTGLPGYTTDDQLKNLEGQPLWYANTDYDMDEVTTTPGPDELKVFVRVGPYNVNPETAIDKASVISHEYGHSLGLPDFYSNDGTRETYGDWNLMATDKSQNIDAFGRQELGWVVPEVLDSSRSETGIPDSKTDIGEITWQTEDGTPYTLHNGADGIVHNSKMYVAKLPGRQILDPALFDTGDTASKTHAWWSQSGNDFGCTPTGGHNLDLLIPELATIDPDSEVTLEFKSLWDIEWDFDYGFVLTTTDGGQSYTSHASDNGYTTSNTDPTAPANNQCQTTYNNGLTGSSGSYDAGTQTLDRNPAAPSYPEPVFLADSYDISDLAGESLGALRFSYATDPGLARPGWFIDDVTVTVTEPGESPRQVLVTDLETSGGPDDERIYNGGCREDLMTATQCTVGWSYVSAGDTSAADHAYYMELRDRSGFDFEGHNQIDRDPIGFQPGLSLVYTDESHGYGNAGTPDPPAQSPLDSVPQPGEPAPNLNDAAFIDAPGRTSYTDNHTTPHVDNYADPSSESGNWEFAYDCLTFNVNSMNGEETIQLAGDLTGAVTFNVGSGCGEFDYGYVGAGGTPGTNTKPTAKAKATPANAETNEEVKLSADGTTDAETPNDLDYSWDFGDGGTTKDAVGKNVKNKFKNPGTFKAKVTVTDPQGLTDTATTTVTVTNASKPVAKISVKPKKPFIRTKVTLSAKKSTGDGLKYSWNFGNGGKTDDASGVSPRHRFKKPGYQKVSLTVTDSRGRSDTTTERILVRRAVKCGSPKVDKTGSWRKVRSLNAPNGKYCDNLGNGRGPDTLTYHFKGPQIDVYHGRSSQGGKAAVYVDGQREGTIDFSSTSTRLKFKSHHLVKGLSKGKHTVRVVILSGQAYIASFISIK